MSAMHRKLALAHEVIIDPFRVFAAFRINFRNTGGATHNAGEVGFEAGFRCMQAGCPALALLKPTR